MILICDRLRMWGFACGMAAGFSMRAELFSALNGTELKSETAGQVVTLWVENHGASAVPALGGTMEFIVEDVSHRGRLPRISSVKAVGVAGSPFTPSNSRQLNAAGPLGASWLAILETQPDSPPSPVLIQPGARFALAEITLDTTGLGAAGGTWALRVGGVDGNGTFFNTINPADPTDVLEVPVKPVETVLKVADPTAVGSAVVRWGTGGSLILEVDASNGGVAPVVEVTDDLATGKWQATGAGAVLQGGVWRWEMPVDGAKAARFFRMVSAGVGPGMGLNRGGESR